MATVGSPRDVTGMGPKATRIEIWTGRTVCEVLPSVGFMKTRPSLPWPLILALGALALVRPLLRILDARTGFDSPTSLPLIVTLVISAVWVAAVALSRTARPVLTLVLAGLAYAVFSILLSGLLSPLLDGELRGPLATPIAIVPVLTINAAWGLVTGVLALLVQRGALQRA